jgi:hypothetical protein
MSIHKNNINPPELDKQMNAPDIFHSHEKPLNVADFNIFLQSSPPQIIEKTIYDYDAHNSDKDETNLLEQTHDTTEGRLNIRVCQFSNNKISLYILGKVQGKDVRLNKEVVVQSSNGFILLSEKVRYTLTQSKNILKLYYQRANLKSLEDHLIAFLPI